MFHFLFSHFILICDFTTKQNRKKNQVQFCLFMIFWLKRKKNPLNISMDENDINRKFIVYLGLFSSFVRSLTFDENFFFHDSFAWWSFFFSSLFTTFILNFSTTTTTKKSSRSIHFTIIYRFLIQFLFLFGSSNKNQSININIKIKEKNPSLIILYYKYFYLLSFFLFNLYPINITVWRKNKKKTNHFVNHLFDWK